MNARLPVKTTELVLNFAEAVQKGTSGTIKIVNCGGDHLCNAGAGDNANADAQTFDVTGNNVEVDGTKVTVYLYKALDYSPGSSTKGYRYFLQIPDTALLDAAGNQITGYSNSPTPANDAATRLTFSVDGLAPKKSPAGTDYGAGSIKLYVAGTDTTGATGATSASYTQNLLLQFSEPVEPGSGNANMFKFSRATNDNAAIAFSGPGRAAASGTATGVYTNHDGTKVLLVSGDNGATKLGTAANTDYGLRIFADALVDRASGNKVASGATITFGTPATAGAAGNVALVAPANDVTKPVIHFSTPENGQSAGVLTDSTLDLYWSEKVVAQNLADGITITKCSGSYSSIPLSSCSADGSVTNVNPSNVGTVNAAGIFSLSNAQLGGALTAGKTYKVVVKAAAFRDTSTNTATCTANGCANDEVTIYFTVADPSAGTYAPGSESSAPKVQKSTSALTSAVDTTGSPAMAMYTTNAVLSSRKPTLKIVLNEEVQPFGHTAGLAAKIRVKKCQAAYVNNACPNANLANDNLAVTLSAGNVGYPFGTLTTRGTADKAYFYGKNVYVTPGTNLAETAGATQQYETQKWLDIEASAIKDLNSNAMAAYQNSNEFKFKTPEDTNAAKPALIACAEFDSSLAHDSCTGGTSGVSRTGALTCYASTAVYLDPSVTHNARFCTAHDDCTTSVAATVAVSTDGLSVSFTPASALTHNDAYWLKWSADFLKDAYGNGIAINEADNAGGTDGDPAAENNNFCFTTANDNGAPSVTITAPADSGATVSTTGMILLTLGEACTSASAA